MAERIDSLPDVLVLGAGGTLGIAWLRGVLGGLETASGLDFRGCEYFVGTSAGSFVGALLAAGERPGGDLPTPASPDSTSLPPAEEGPRGRVRRIAQGGGRLAVAASAPVMPLALRATRPGGAIARAAILAVSPRPDRPAEDLRAAVEGLGIDFDGRLRVVAVDRARGRRVVFGAPGEPRPSVADAVAASCSIPWVFAPVEIDGRQYVDGGVWSPSNLDVAPGGRGSNVLALLPALAQRGGRGAQGVMRAAVQAATLAELQVLRARGARVRIIGPDPAAMAAIGSRFMDASRRPEVTEAGIAQGARLA